ncbi:hypothetical protein YC2023_036545 [Brassica napus]
MLHKIWAAISRIRPCRCQKDDVVHRENSPSSSGSGSSGTHRVRKRSKRPNDAGTSGAGDEDFALLDKPNNYYPRKEVISSVPRNFLGIS